MVQMHVIPIIRPLPSTSLDQQELVVRGMPKILVSCPRSLLISSAADFETSL
jgi:hypothetical protein